MKQIPICIEKRNSITREWIHCFYWVLAVNDKAWQFGIVSHVSKAKKVIAYWQWVKLSLTTEFINLRISAHLSTCTDEKL